VAQLELDPRTEGQEATIVVRGEVDMATAPQLRELLHSLADGGVESIVLECRDLEFLDSTGIGVLVAVRNRLGDRGKLIIDSPPPHVRKVLELTGVGDCVSIVP
jgi:anti-sigma B factor antagonist